MKLSRPTLVLAAMLLAACAATPETRTAYDRYSDLIQAEQTAAQLRMASLARMVDACAGDARCVETVAGYAALASVAGTGGGSGSQIAAPQREPGGVEKFAMVMGAVSPLAQAGLGFLSHRESSRAQVETTRILWGGLSDIVGSTTGRMADVAAGATPSITVGGDYVPGSQHHGDYAGRDLISGHQGDTIGRDRIGRDQHVGDRSGRDLARGDRNFNTGRQDSPGPFDESGDCRDGGDCSEPAPPPPDDGGG